MQIVTAERSEWNVLLCYDVTTYFQSLFPCTRAFTMLLKKRSEWNVLRCYDVSTYCQSRPCTNTCKLLLQNAVSGTCYNVMMLQPSFKARSTAQVHLDTIFRDHGFRPWNAASQEQSKQCESQTYEPIHTAFMEPAMTNHLCM